MGRPRAVVSTCLVIVALALLAVSTLAFAGAHWEPAHVVLALPLGLLFGWLRWRSESLLPSLVAHIVNNTGVCLILLYAPTILGWAP